MNITVNISDRDLDGLLTMLKEHFEIYSRGKEFIEWWNNKPLEYAMGRSINEVFRDFDKYYDKLQ